MRGQPAGGWEAATEDREELPGSVAPPPVEEGAGGSP
jgi:hypothetical protein